MGANNIASLVLLPGTGWQHRINNPLAKTGLLADTISRWYFAKANKAAY